MDVVEERNGLDFDVAKSLRYHAYRRSFWDSVDSFSKILTIASGTSVLVTVVGKWERWAEGLAIVVALASASDTVLGFSLRARDHDGLYRRFSMLAQDISTNQEPTAQIVVEWRRRRLEIEMDEPSVMDWLERRCSGEEAISRGLKRHPAWKLRWYQVFFSQLAFWPSP